MLEFTISDHTDKGVIRRINVYHKDEKITFKNDASRSPLTNPKEVLQSLNDFVGHFSEEQCDALFEVYRELYEISEYSNGSVTPVGLIDIRNRVEELYKIVNPESINAWGDDYNRFHNPHLPELTGYAVETTYTSKEYRQLLSLTTLLKFMMPIWGEFYNSIKDVYGKELVELTCFNLLQNTGIFDLPAYHRLEKYVLHNKPIAEILILESKPLPMTLVMEGYSDQDLLPFILSRIVVKNMTFSETTLQKLKGKDNNLIGVIHHVIGRRLEDLEKGFGGKMGDIRHPSENKKEGEEGNTSITENFSAKTEVTDVEPRLFNIFCQDKYRLANTLYPKGQLDVGVVDKFIDFVYYLAEHNNFWYDKGRQFIVTTMLFGVIPEQGIVYLNRQSILNVVGVSCAILHTVAVQTQIKDPNSIGLFDMVKYLLAKPTGTPDVEISGRAQQAKSSYIPDDIVNELGHYYNYTNAGEPGVKEITDWITEFVKTEICSTFWVEQSPDNWDVPLNKVYQNKNEWYADKEMKSFICLLFIMVFQRCEAQLKHHNVK